MRFMAISMNFLCAYKNALGSSGMKTSNKSVNQEIKMNNWIPLISMICLCISRNSPDSSDRKKKIREYRRVNKKDLTRWKLSAITTASRRLSKSVSG